MRLKSEIWVKAYVRICASNGAPAMVVKRGDADAGAIYIKVSTLDGRARLYTPAPAGQGDAGSTRTWLSGAETADEAIEERLERERSFDTDLWIVEVEDRSGRHFLDAWLTE